MLRKHRLRRLQKHRVVHKRYQALRRKVHLKLKAYHKDSLTNSNSYSIGYFESNDYCKCYLYAEHIPDADTDEYTLIYAEPIANTDKDTEWLTDPNSIVYPKSDTVIKSEWLANTNAVIYSKPIANAARSR